MTTNKSLLTLALVTSTLASADMRIDVSGTIETIPLQETVIIETKTKAPEDELTARVETDNMSIHCAVTEETEEGVKVELDIMIQDDTNGGVTMINTPVELKWEEQTRVPVLNNETDDAVMLTVTAHKQ